MKKDPIFKNFTHRFEISKTLKFELKPVGVTKDLLEQDGIFNEGRDWKNKYEKSKQFFDRLHREFVQEALLGVVFDDMDTYLETYRAWRRESTDEKSAEALRTKENELRKNISQAFDTLAKQWITVKYGHLGLKESGIDFLFGEGVFRILKERYGSEKDALLIDPESGEIIGTVFDNWKGFTGYFKKFHETRKNFYKDDGKVTAIATRMIDQNLRWFAENILIFENLQKKINFKSIEKSSGIPISRIFSVKHYGEYLLQEGIDTYNVAINGIVAKGDEKSSGINGIVREFLQNNKGERLLLLKTLSRQILGVKEMSSHGIYTDARLLETLRTFHDVAMEKIPNLLRFVEVVGTRTGELDLDKVYLSKEAVHTIAHKLLKDPEAFPFFLYSAFKAAGDTSASYRKEGDSYSFPDFISFSRVDGALSLIKDVETAWKPYFYVETMAETGEKLLFKDESIWEQNIRLAGYQFRRAFQRTVVMSNGKTESRGFAVSSRRMGELLASPNPEINADFMTVVKDFSDDVLLFYQMGRYFALEKNRSWVMGYEMDPLFYSDPETGYMGYYEGAYEGLVLPYERIREYLTRKPWENVDKWKLNFGIPTFADGWDKNKEPASATIILRQKGRYFLGVMRKGNTRLFEARNAEQMISDAKGGRYEKMEYKLLPDPAKMMPKVCFSKKGIAFFHPTPGIVDIYKNGTFKKGDSFNSGDLKKLVDFYKKCLVSYPGWQEYDFSQVKASEEYGNGIGEFYADVARAGYKIGFSDVSASYIKEKNMEGELYLFEIYNQDYAAGTTGKRNLHTMYFEGLFPPNNTHDFLLKLNGQSEVFFRPAVAVERLGTRKDAKGKEVVAQKRYAENKILFHCPMTLNRGRGTSGINREVNAFLAGNKNVNVIGVDRGEMNIAHYTVVNQKQEIIESGSLNEIDGVDYAEKIREKKEIRDNWSSSRAMRELKLGYVTQIVRKLSDLAIQHDAVIVLEDFNMRFKQVQGGIEKGIYQQMEKALIVKLGYLVTKDEKDPNRAGHLLNAFQLASPVESFQKMGKQTGIIFYVQSGNASRVDPITGWRPNLQLRYGSAEKAKMEILKFSNIVFDKKRKRFEMTYDLRRFQERKNWPVHTVWTVCTSVERLKWDGAPGKGDCTHYPDLTSPFRTLFEYARIDIEKEIMPQIMPLPAKGNEKFFKDFMFLWNLLCQIKNNTASGVDFLLSPVEPFFDSRTPDLFGKNFPSNSDSAGSYSMARKGVLILLKLKEFRDKNGTCEKLNWGDLYISNDEWDGFLTREMKTTAQKKKKACANALEVVNYDTGNKPVGLPKIPGTKGFRGELDNKVAAEVEVS